MSRNNPSSRGAPGLRGLACVVLLVAAPLSCGVREPSSGRPASPNVLLITIDTLRADRLGCYGSKTTRTPAIDRLASEGTLFEVATCPMQLTKPSHFSLFTSVYPRDHGVVNNELPLTADLPTISEVFRDAGYQTAGIASVRLLGTRSGADRGFEHFESPEKVLEWTADKTVPRAMQWLESRDTSRSFFLWLHLFDPHTPYDPPAEYAPASSPEVEKLLPDSQWVTLSRVAQENGGDLPRDAYDRLVALYGGEVEYVDHWMETLFDRLRATGDLDRTIVVFTADHGECFENGYYFDHAGCLYDGSALIPLIVRYPTSVPAGSRRGEIVETLDLAPTILALADLPAPKEFQGRDLFDDADPPRETTFLQHPIYNTKEARARTQKLSELRGVSGLPPSKPLVTEEEGAGLRTLEWKYIVTGESEELYPVPSAEDVNVAADHPEALSRLRPILEEWRNAHPLKIQESEKMDEDLLKTLRGLGYVK